MGCTVCGHPEESDTHAVLECLLAVNICEGCDFEEELWASRHRTLMDCIDKARTRLDNDRFGDFLAVM